MAIVPDHPIWRRSRRRHHGGAWREYAKGSSSEATSPRGPGTSPAQCPRCAQCGPEEYQATSDYHSGSSESSADEQSSSSSFNMAGTCLLCLMHTGRTILASFTILHWTTYSSGLGCSKPDIDFSGFSKILLPILHHHLLLLFLDFLARKPHQLKHENKLQDLSSTSHYRNITEVLLWRVQSHNQNKIGSVREADRASNDEALKNISWKILGTFRRTRCHCPGH